MHIAIVSTTICYVNSSVLALQLALHSPQISHTSRIIRVSQKGARPSTNSVPAKARRFDLVSRRPAAPAGSSVVPKPFEAFDHDSSVGPILVLNLERQVERWKLFQSEARRHQLRNGGSLLDRCERVTAVDGLTAPVGSFLPSEIDAIYSLEDFYFVDPQPVLSQLGTRAGLTVTESPQETAVAQSHLNAWKRVANDGVTTLVVEDDAQFLHDFEFRLARICAELPDIGASEPTFDLLYLSYRSAESGMERITY